MEQVEMNNMYINIGVNNGSEKGTEKKHCGLSWEYLCFDLYICRQQT